VNLGPHSPRLQLLASERQTGDPTEVERDRALVMGRRFLKEPGGGTLRPPSSGLAGNLI
jgi:hypothetical protein